MLYVEKEDKSGTFFRSYCIKNLGKRYSQWVVPCRILNISPAEFIKLLINKYNAIIKYCPNTNLLYYYWISQKDESLWRNYINKIAREKNFQI